MLKIYYNFNFSIYSNFLMAHLNSYANVATLFANIDSIKKYPEFTEVCEFIRYADWNSFTLRNVSISGKACLKSSGTHTQEVQGGQGLRIPACFGIIAIQLLAASSRHDDEFYTANAYNPRLANLLGIKENNLQQKYSSAQFHSRSRNTFSSCSVREIAFIVFFECGMKIVPADVWGRQLSG